LAKKKKIEKPKRKLTRRQLSHWQKQKRRQRFILGLGISVIIAVVGIVSAGFYYQWYIPKVKPLSEIVIEVNDTKFDMQYCIDAINFQLGEYSYYVEYYIDYVLETIEEYELIRQKALALGISVSDEEVDEELKSLDLPLDNQAIRDVSRTQLIINKLDEEYFDPQVPVSAEQRHIMAMFLESQSQADEVWNRILFGEDFGELASELSLESLTQEGGGDLGWRPKGVLNDLLGASIQELDELIFNYTIGITSYLYDETKTKDVGYWLVQVLERTEEPEEAHVQVMLLSSEEEAQGVIARLETGEDFGELAEEFSQYGTEGSKADIGWIAEGGMTQAFEDYVFDPETEMNVVSSPIRDETPTTKGGYWLFKVLDEGTREISEEDRDLLVDEAMVDWVASLWDDPENIIVSYLDDDMKNFAINKVLGD